MTKPNIINYGKNNKCIVVKKDGSEFQPEYIEGLSVIFYGENSIVKVFEPYNFVNCKLEMGDDFQVIINKTKYLIQNVVTDSRIRGSKFISGVNCSFNGLKLVMQEDGCDIIFGDDCMSSYNVILRPTDSHLIYDEKTKVQVNKKEAITIRNHV